MVELHRLSTRSVRFARFPDAVISWYGSWTFLVSSRLLIKMSNETLVRAALNVINLSQNVEVDIVGVKNQTTSVRPGLWKPCCLADAKTAPRTSHKLTHSKSLAFIIAFIVFQVPSRVHATFITFMRFMTVIKITKWRIVKDCCEIVKCVSAS